MNARISRIHPLPGHRFSDQTEIFVHSYVLTLNADDADRAFDEPPNWIGKCQSCDGLVGRGAGTYERTDNPSIFDIATPIVSFVHSYVCTLKLTALAEHSARHTLSSGPQYFPVGPG
jgi:hypothetical protein